MKILQTPSRFYPYIGGVENYVYHLSKELIKLGHKIKVICADEPSIGDGIIDGIQVKRLNYMGKIANTNITPKLPQTILKEDFDIIHTHLPTPWSADWSAVVSLIKNKPLILTYHNDIVGEGIYSYIAKSYNFILLPLLLKSAKKIIVTHKRYIDFSPHLKEYIKKIEVIPPGIDLDKFKPMPQTKRREKIILFVGILDKFHRYKGLDYLIKAMTFIKRDIFNVKLIVGGNGVLKEEYIKLSRSLGLEKQIDFVGFIPQNKLIEYYNNCDVFVLPSLSSEQEGFGIVLLEAMACGKPVVTTNIVGLAENIKSIGSGRVIEPGKEIELSKAIIEILNNEDLANEMGQKARKLTEENYSWNLIAKKILELYYDYQK
jgi:glycosyltransferase involved in cell wall biosynthesis